ncbi:hypothetical protein Hypma_000674 [Hypsizygus marmoreus]|uniref:Uncharacterized protein n=1 Tax=Hypsizygus marmoreus TaxID=39966 RepID=A0A369J8Y6_HYPMA|nr:hypothetical protein Hypma_000674 [Hypsizygus marmoreus]
MEWRGGPATLRLDRVGFVPGDDPDAFSFIDPALVIRACHLVPAFSLGRTFRLLRPSVARDKEVFISLMTSGQILSFVDLDMMMRYLGLGVGHCQTADFPREDKELKTILTGPSYEPLPAAAIASATPQEQDEVIEDEEVYLPQSDDDDEDSTFNEKIYDL